MGNGHSSNRRGRHASAHPIPSAGLPPPRSVPVHPPAGYPGSYATQPTTAFDFPVLTGVGMTPPPMGHHGTYYGTAPFFPAGGQYLQTNGQYFMGGPLRPPMLTPHPPHVPTMQMPQETSVVQNDLNLSKASLKLVPDEENPGHWLVAFSFDATVAGSLCIFVKAKEGEGLSITQTKPYYTPRRIGFNKGSAQKFTQQSGTGIDLTKFNDKELAKEIDGVFPLIVRLETVPKNPPLDAPSRENAPPGEQLPKWVQAQTTYAVFYKKSGGTWAARVLKQKLWVDGQVYELQEIYGIDNGGGGGGESGDYGKECVICLSEPRDTTVLPCRHMCMCGTCANYLRHQTNRCPICRCVVESLLEINVNDRQDAMVPDSQDEPAGSRGKDKCPQERAPSGTATCSSSLQQKQ